MSTSTWLCVAAQCRPPMPGPKRPKAPTSPSRDSSLDSLLTVLPEGPEASNSGKGKGSMATSCETAKAACVDLSLNGDGYSRSRKAFFQYIGAPYKTPFLETDKKEPHGRFSFVTVPIYRPYHFPIFL